MSDLRQRRHAQTKQALFDAAFDLLRAHGLHALTMERIAEHAGVSRSTAYRRYASKEDIILDIPRQFVAAWDDALQRYAESNPDAPETPASLAKKMNVGCLGVASWIDTNSDNVLLGYKALESSPTLQASDTSHWVERMIELIMAHVPDADLATAATIAGAYMGALDAMMVLWVRDEGATSVTASTQAVLDHLGPILPT